MNISIESDDNSNSEFAVLFKNVFKSYDKKGPLVLNNFSMNVRKGSIYGLLGSSGCGKTTTLSCILGISKWESGEILVFGEKPGSISQENLSKRIGYVPQDTALYEHLSIKENIQYYGRLYGLPEKDIFEQWKILQNLLQLPRGFKQVKNLSGGEQRRVSLALALVHQPELLILDEPTAGLDPLLRESVWDYLFTLARNKGNSIIITTHYIEETKKSDVIGVMRNGCLLQEDSPTKLLAKHNTHRLEDVVLKLCRENIANLSIGNSSDSISTSSTASINTIPSENFNTQNGNTENNLRASKNIALLVRSKWESESTLTSSLKVFQDIFSFFRRTLATCLVLFLLYIRDPLFFLGALVLPAYQVLLTFGCMGNNPKALNLAIVNDEIPDWQTKCFVELPMHSPNDDCNFTQMSCRYLQYIGSHNIVKMLPYNNTLGATNGVHSGDLWGYMYFSRNYSQHTFDRFSAKQFATEEAINGSTIRVQLDMSAYLGSFMIIKHLYEQLQEYGRDLVNSCNGTTSVVDLPLKFRKPVYGSEIDSYYDYYIPGVYTNILFVIPLHCAMLIFVAELKIGTFGRAQVAGRTIGELITAHAISQMLILLGQVVICTLCMKFTYNFSVAGSLVLYAVVALVIGICGQNIGILLAVIIQDGFECLMISVFIAMTTIVSGGVLWPLAYVQPVWRYIGKILPTTMITESFRSVVVRGVGITHEFVWSGVACAVAWIAAIWIIVVVSSKKCIN